MQHRVLFSEKPKILMLAIEPPRSRGLGGEVRTFHFVRALAQQGELTLAVLDPVGERVPDADIAKMCKAVFRPMPSNEGEGLGRLRSPRLLSWLRTLGVLFAPWRDNWSRLLSYWLQFCPVVPQGEGKPLKRSRRVLSALLDLEFRIAARCCSVPSMLTFYYAEAFRRMIPRLVEAGKAERFDVIWVEHSFIYPFAQELLRSMGKTLVVCNAHNVEFRLQERHVGLAKTRREKGYWHDQSRLMRNIETRAFRDSDLVIACSEQDRASVLDLAPSARVTVIGNGVDAKNVRPCQPRGLAPVPTVLFTGTFSYGPNVDAAGYFVREIFPVVKREIPSCRFVVAGYLAQSALDQAGIRDDSLTCVTSPEDMRPLFDQAWAFVVPLRIGGGTRLKILEAMAMEVPVVSTRIGAEGVPYVDGTHLLLADAPQEFAAALIRLLSDAELRAGLAAKAAQFARQNYDWELLCDRGMEKLQEVVADRRQNTVESNE
ncbi:MAG: glycosyltransferase family 4 protein [Verrucomicrobiota bacterium]